ncbi:MAG: DUF3858 domain-containing protein [Firmicutes bacterium]|nr:DUF3858 domain-containing protein [Bacillota bacterium]
MRKNMLLRRAIVLVSLLLGPFLLGRSASAGWSYPSEGMAILEQETIYDFTGDEHKSYYNYVVEVLEESNNHLCYEKSFFPDAEEIQLNEAKVVRPDGTVVEPEIDIVPVYNKDDRETILRFYYPDAAKKGNVLQQSVVHTYKEQLFTGEYYRGIPLHTNYFCRRRRIVVKVRAERPLYFKARTVEVKPIIEEAEGVLTYTWEFNELPAYVAEVEMVDERRPYLEFSSFGTWTEYAAFAKDLYADRYVVDKEIKAKIRELANGKRREEKIRALYDFVAQNIWYESIRRFLIEGYKPPTAAEVYHSGKGDCKAQAILLIAMLREIGVQAEPALLNTSKTYDYDGVAGPKFNHVIVYLPKEDLFLDTTADFVPYGELLPTNQGRVAYLFESDRFLRIPAYPEKDYTITEKKIKLYPAGSVEVFLTQSLEGGNYFHQRNYYDGDLLGHVVYTLNKIKAMAPGYETEYYHIFRTSRGERARVSDAEIEFGLKRDLNGEERETEWSIRPFFTPLEYGLWNMEQLVASDERIYPVKLNVRPHVIKKIEIELPSAYETLTLPHAVYMQNRVGSLRMDVEKRENKVYIDFEFQLHGRIVQPEDYPALKRLIEKAVAVLKDETLLIIY